ncbi:MAG: excinuclease ABC subunit A [Roseobacter sp. MedPE-SW]|nr:MAG: excinuclease ABC subunit A [Roseobacter sp. MedPE-SW]
MTHDTATKALKGAALATVLFGLAMVLALITPLRAVFEIFLDLVHYPLDGQQGLTSDSAHVLTAISGGLLVGLGALIWGITQEVYAKRPDIGARIILVGVFAWYLPDSFGSYMVGAWFNMVLNTGFLAIFVLPILLHRQSSKKTVLAQG